MKANLVLTGGEHRSRRLHAPEGRDTRPTRALVREALFNMLQGVCPGAGVLDLFAGSGALGFEALSRGAAQLVLCDHAAPAMAVIRQNAALLREKDKCRFLQTDWQQALTKLGAEKAQFDLVLLDPPYGMALGPVLDRLLALDLLEQEAIIAIEHGERTEIQLPPGLSQLRSRRYGESQLTLITQARQEEA